ncbi:hypothetical protein C7S16_5474 [Burkholderia thailandensis]|uniref:Uncharacterized protein n=1 Tax=Burkholderia thailandensis TaxID=57975 RepID=A0AAW9CX36_BURTH|nr:hypothetical protein [Burkholderia thailandensis]MDW9253608.1 hypothetical protein [Burkholderia thailandensis]
MRGRRCFRDALVAIAQKRHGAGRGAFFAARIGGARRRADAAEQLGERSAALASAQRRFDGSP